MTTTPPDQLLCWADDALITAQRLAAWCARAPELEEDVALTNIALDQLGVARLLLSYAAEQLTPDAVPAAPADQPVTEDTLAFLRSDQEFRNCLLVELPDDDYAMTIGKLLFLAAYQLRLYAVLSAGADQRLAAIAGKAAKESTYHLDHARLWTLRLGDGTEESRRRMQYAVDELWPYTYELVAPVPGSGPADLRADWLAVIGPILAEATLAAPAGTGSAAAAGDGGGWRPGGGRLGRHTEHLSYLLAEMQVVHRAHPGARW
ncbi:MULTISPECIES: 1,2-phenylacetyl-CoA epoxidase subunit PaaC [unclassified Solwaraspora]|uniref:1,2-phenylacetyl-CoA epoxidase subunit PaaC n=1 Tax=unclassified Solwaraspora TaxID=2627926 RepID=UPI00248AF7E3|nr:MULTISPECIES: 1,2-phenylacetyl-CoA epoxidase subunit PaaC [unclassified Solwaraspora]WBB96598.1 phenylacetate-CoA oxygenase subunit PaaC [Solwaraspora sp. WMMA2059]WJK32919.1 1,2-phenylacetyl-CoA epoxidase subunit PaaC [Solwaraspora sp. WMMA2065]